MRLLKETLIRSRISYIDVDQNDQVKDAHKRRAEARRRHRESSELMNLRKKVRFSSNGGKLSSKMPGPKSHRAASSTTMRFAEIKPCSIAKKRPPASSNRNALASTNAFRQRLLKPDQEPSQSTCRRNCHQQSNESIHVHVTSGLDAKKNRIPATK